MHKKRIFLSVLAIWMAIVSCNLPAAQEAVNPSSADLTATAMAASAAKSASIPNTPAIPATVASAIPSFTLEPTATFTASPTPCIPTVVATSSVNIRSGPGTVYPAVGALTPSASAPIAGKSADGTWWYITYGGGYGWVSGSVVTASCVPVSVAVIAAPPTPLPPSGSCKDGYVFRLAIPSDKVCVLPTSKTQSDADNAAADSRKIISIYGPNACVEGYVWRVANPSDYVCVTVAVRSQTAADNAAAASRWVVGPYGPHTCISGFVWREAFTGDDVCVTPSVRTQALSDNAAANSRKAINVYGPDACIPG